MELRMFTTDMVMPLQLQRTMPISCAYVQAVAKGKKNLKGTGSHAKYAFVLSKEAQNKVSQTSTDMTAEGHIPRG